MTLSRLLWSLGAGAMLALLCGCGANLARPAAPTGSLDWRMRPPASSLQDIYNFAGSPNGKLPEGPIAHTATDSMTTTTAEGGDSNNDGTVVGFSQKGGGGKWTESVLYTFKGGTYGDGSQPVGIWRGTPDVDVFVSAASGGTSGNGALVELTPTSSGSLDEGFIYSFGGAPDGANPWGSVVADKAGNLYGTTMAGGAYYSGTVYRMQPKASSYTESVQYNFGGIPYDGGDPMGGLIIDKSAALYGTTKLGGSGGHGTVFKLTPSKSTYTESILHSFEGSSDGVEPEAGVTAAFEHGDVRKPYLYGTTVYGGANDEGTVYEVTPSGSGYSILWNFGSVAGDGMYPIGGVCVSKKGVIYGTTLGGGSGGSSGLGTFFTLTPSGKTYKESVYSFTGANGEYPYATPSFYSKGGKGGWLITAGEGGANNMGAVDLWTSTNWSGYCAN